MVESGTSSSFEPTGPVKHDRTPKEAAVLGTLHYIIIFTYAKKKSSTTSMFLHELDFVGLRRMSLADFTIVRTQVPIPVAGKENSPAKTCEKMEDILTSGFKRRILNWQQTLA